MIVYCWDKGTEVPGTRLAFPVPTRGFCVGCNAEVRGGRARAVRTDRNEEWQPVEKPRFLEEVVASRKMGVRWFHEVAVLMPSGTWYGNSVAEWVVFWIK